MTSKNFNKHLVCWQGCSRCDCSSFTQHKVLYRGPIPCDVLVIGEAPGDTELVLAKPFVGPSGKYLNRMLTEASHKTKVDAYIGYTNAIACAPVNEDSFRLRPPSNVEISNCSDRLKECIEIADPIALLVLGGTAKKAINKLSKYFESLPTYYAIHPSAILRQGERGSLDQARLRETLEEMFFALGETRASKES